MRLEEVADPEPTAGQVLVRVAVAGVNLLDTLHRSGRTPVAMPTGIGLEGAGTIVGVGPGGDQGRCGQRVAWHGTIGSYAELVAVDEADAVPLADGLDEALAAAVLHQGMTAHYLTHATTQPGADDIVLVHGASGGVGHLLVQLARQRGARVIAATSTAAKAERVRALGADDVVLYGHGDLVTEVRRCTAGRGVDVVYDGLGRLTFPASLDCLRQRGALVVYGTTTGPVPPFDPQILAEKGSVLVTRPAMAAYTADPEEASWHATAVLDLAASGQLAVDIHGRYPLAEAARSHADLESGTTSGKLLLVP